MKLQINVQLLERSCANALMENFGKQLFYHQFSDVVLLFPREFFRRCRSVKREIRIDNVKKDVLKEGPGQRKSEDAAKMPQHLPDNNTGKIYEIICQLYVSVEIKNFG